MPEPDFLGVGSHLSGTQWWRGLLADHPQVSLRPVGHEGLETFFEPFCQRPMTAADVAAYHARFKSRAGTLAGEWSDRYLYNAWMLPLLKRAAPDAKLLVLLRDPVERYRIALGYRLPEQAERRAVHMQEAFHRGRYAAQLRTLERFFGRDRVLVQQYERCVIDPIGEYRRMVRFLGLDESHLPRAIRRRPPEPNAVRYPWLRKLLGRPLPVQARLWPDIEAALQVALADDARQLAGDVDLRLWPSFAHLAENGAVHG